GDDHAVHELAHPGLVQRRREVPHRAPVHPGPVHRALLPSPRATALRAASPTSSASSTTRHEYAHSLSYQPTSLAVVPLTMVRPASSTQLRASPTTSAETIGSSV